MEKSMTLSPQQALLRCIENREIFHDEMLALFRQIMGGEMSPVMIAALTMGCPLYPTAAAAAPTRLQTGILGHTSHN